jgi:hypothetical protein
VLLRFGVSCAMILVPRGAIGALLKSYCPKMCVDAESFGFILDVRNMFNVMTDWGNNLSHRCIVNDLSVVQSPDINMYLKNIIALSDEFSMWLYGGTNWKVVSCW